MDQGQGLERFVAAQDAGGAYGKALHELRCGLKTSHWMWFVFPQLKGLGRSTMAQRYAIVSIEEAREYVSHPILGPRLRECSHALLTHHDRPAEAILGRVDAVKLRSSATLFARAEPAEPVFSAILDQFFGGRSDANTDAFLGAAARD